MQKAIHHTLRHTFRSYCLLSFPRPLRTPHINIPYNHKLKPLPSLQYTAISLLSCRLFWCRLRNDLSLLLLLSLLLCCCLLLLNNLLSLLLKLCWVPLSRGWKEKHSCWKRSSSRRSSWLLLCWLLCHLRSHNGRGFCCSRCCRGCIRTIDGSLCRHDGLHGNYVGIL